MKTATRALVLITAFVLVLQAAPAHAAGYASGGRVGYSSVSRGRCDYMTNGLRGWLRTSTAPPAIYARNYRTGYGNDAQRVRYRAFVVDANTGATITSSGYSAWAWAWDNSPAQFSGSTVFDLEWRGNYVVDIRIEWLNRYGQISGWSAHRINVWDYFWQQINYGRLSSCFRY